MPWTRPQATAILVKARRSGDAKLEEKAKKYIAKPSKPRKGGKVRRR